MKNTTDEFLCLISHLREANVSRAQVAELGVFIREHFDELELSQLYQNLKAEGGLKQFNAYMALLNKYEGFSKKLIPFELDLQDYVLADKFMKRMSV